MTGEDGWLIVCKPSLPLNPAMGSPIYFFQLAEPLHVALSENPIPTKEPECSHANHFAPVTQKDQKGVSTRKKT
jgi:hypothetical protein